jgi:hypothetical protein
MQSIWRRLVVLIVFASLTLATFVPSVGAHAGPSISVAPSTISVPMTVAAQQNAMWYSQLQYTGCYGGTEVHLITNNAPMNGALVYFDGGIGYGYFYAYHSGGNAWVVEAYGGARPWAFNIDWKYSGISGSVWINCF